MICIDEFEDNLIHHLPNRYINHISGDSTPNLSIKASDKMEKALKTLLK